MTSLIPRADAAPRLVDVAAGRAPADLVIRGGRWVNVHSGEILPDADIAVAAGRFARCGPDASDVIGPDTQVIEARGRHLVPGLIDAHMHVESGMLTVTEFVRAVAPHGTTSMFVDPHEIANVLGLQGVRLMHDEALDQPGNVFVQAPSCVPSAPGLEEAGAELGPEEIAEMMSWPNIVGLGEVMNFPGVAANDPKMTGEIAEAVREGKTVGGHYASPDLGLPFHAYAAGGPADDHEGTRMEDAIARVRLGMRAMLRLGSAWHDVADQIRAVTEQGLDPRNFILCTDDCYASTLVHEGHMDRVVRHAIAQGLAPVTAIQMATLNPATHFGMERELGAIAPGRRADLILTDTLPGLRADMVVARGQVVAEAGAVRVPRPAFVWPDYAKKTTRLGRALTAEDFRIPAPRAPRPPAPASSAWWRTRPRPRRWRPRSPSATAPSRRSPPSTASPSRTATAPPAAWPTRWSRASATTSPAPSPPRWPTTPTKSSSSAPLPRTWRRRPTAWPRPAAAWRCSGRAARPPSSPSPSPA